METLERRKELMINGFWSNDGMNDDKGTRQTAIDELETSFGTAIAAILSSGGKPAEKEAEIDKSNPFFAAIKDVPKLEDPSEANLKTVEAVVEDQRLEFDIDQ